VGGCERIVFAAPPQHGKTELTLHALVMLLARHPARRFAYVTYNDQRTLRVARAFRRLADRAGIAFENSMLACQVTRQGGQMLFTSIDGGITGEPVDGVAVIDDPFKGPQDSGSAARREIVDECCRKAIFPRVHPGASIVLMATRWHPDDQSGRLIKEGWPYIRLPAVAEEDDPIGRAVGEPLFPKLWPLHALEATHREVLDHAWQSLYQGRPRPRGGKVFHEPAYYRRLPETYRGAFGVDLAYTARSSADWSVLVELWIDDTTGMHYVVDVQRAQVEAPAFALLLKRKAAERPTFRMLWRASGVERGAASFLRDAGLPLLVQTPPGDKLVSATAVAAAWNDQRVLLPDPEVFPESSRWLLPFRDTLQNFSGIGDEADDDVDALGNAHALLSIKRRDIDVQGGRLYER